MFSKVLIISISSLTFMVTFFVCVMVAVTGNLDVLEALIVALYAQLSVIAGFYLNKAKRENEIKLSNIFEQEDEDESVIKDSDLDSEIIINVESDVENGRG